MYQNYCNRTILLKLIVEDVVVVFEAMVIPGKLRLNRRTYAALVLNSTIDESVT